MIVPPFAPLETPGSVVAGTTRGAERIHTLDVLRGVAICGILLMNIASMGGVRDYPLTTFPARWNAEWVSWGVQTLFVQGAMRGLFTILFGAGMLLMLRHADGAAGRGAPIDAWARRSLALMAFGVVQWTVFLWPGEILWNYGVSGLFLLAFRTARPRTLLTAAALLIAGLSANSGYRTWQQVDQLQQAGPVIRGQPLTDAQAAVARSRAAIHPSAAEIAHRIDQRTQYRSLLKWSAGYWTTENIGVTGWIDIAESVSFMLIGMALFRMGVLTGTAPSATYRWMMAAGYGGGLAMRGLAVAIAARSGLDMAAPAVGTPLWAVSAALFEPARLLVTIGHVGLVVTLFRTGWIGRAVTLRALGRMTLTVYGLQALLGAILFYGFGLVGAFGLPALWGIAVGIWIATAWFCRLWLARFEMGPAERLIRAAAYGSFAPRPQARVDPL
jgi:uncharacterized protein